MHTQVNWIITIKGTDAKHELDIDFFNYSKRIPTIQERVELDYKHESISLSQSTYRDFITNIAGKLMDKGYGHDPEECTYRLEFSDIDRIVQNSTFKTKISFVQTQAITKTGNVNKFSLDLTSKFHSGSTIITVKLQEIMIPDKENGGNSLSNWKRIMMSIAESFKRKKKVIYRPMPFGLTPKIDLKKSEVIYELRELRSGSGFLYRSFSSISLASLIIGTIIGVILKSFLESILIWASQRILGTVSN